MMSLIQSKHTFGADSGRVVFGVGNLNLKPPIPQISGLDLCAFALCDLGSEVGSGEYRFCEAFRVDFFRGWLGIAWASRQWDLL